MMQYAYENWATHNRPMEQERRIVEDLSAPPLSEDLRELEESLSMRWEDAEVQGAAHAKEQALLQLQLEKLWHIADRHFQDNKALSAQVQSLLQEREQLKSALLAYELEVSRYRQLVGNLYLKH
ncbi:MAG TPA: hypothetical protein V6C99_06525 [Oculatellaceae cyanobacterium]|jgi:hypothetical protein